MIVIVYANIYVCIYLICNDTLFDCNSRCRRHKLFNLITQNKYYYLMGILFPI